MMPLYCGNFKEKDIDWAITRNYSKVGLCGCIPIRGQLGDYKNAKIIGNMHFSNMSKERPDIFFMSVSPGAIQAKCCSGGTGFAEGAHFPLWFLMRYTPCLFGLLNVTLSLEKGSARYVDGVLIGEPKWPAGAVVMSARGNGLGCGMCFWGANGKVSDNRNDVAYLRDDELCEKVSVAVRKYENQWAVQAKVPLQQTMGS